MHDFELQASSAFRHVHAVLAADYKEQRDKLLAPGKAELAKLRGVEAFERHTAAVQAVQNWPELLKRPSYNGIYSTVKKSYKRKGNRCCTVLDSI
jgi:hypothetical protein